MFYFTCDRSFIGGTAHVWLFTEPAIHTLVLTVTGCKRRKSRNSSYAMDLGLCEFFSTRQICDVA